MGHGLVHSGSLKESFFYPAQHPVLPPALLRAASEGVLRREGSSVSQGGDTPKITPKGRPPPRDGSRVPSRERLESDAGGRTVPAEKKSQLYRNVLNSMTERTVIA